MAMQGPDATTHGRTKMTKQEYDTLMALEAEERAIENGIAVLYQQLKELKRRVSRAIREKRKRQHQIRRKKKPFEDKIEKLFQAWQDDAITA
jgi:hypothetical protein